MPESVGIYYRDDETDELYAFDRVAKNHQEGAYSRSQAVRDSMEMHKMILETMEELGWSDMPEPQRRHAVRQALLNEDRREES